MKIPLKDFRIMIEAVRNGVDELWPDKEDAEAEAMMWWNQAMAGEGRSYWAKEDVLKAAAALFITSMLHDQENSEIAQRN
jgi:hypothetical protein